MGTYVTTTQDSPELVILDVGHGNATIVHEGKATLVVDVACKSAYVLEYLLQRSIDTIDQVILSHSDQDHIGGLVGLICAGVNVKKVQLNADGDKASIAWADLIVALEDARRRNELVFDVGISSGTIIIDGFQRCEIEVAGPTPEIAAFGVGGKDRHGRKISSNSISACLRIIFDKAPVALLTGDIDDVALSAMLEANQTLLAPILVFPHHGGLPGKTDPVEFTERLLNAVKPKSVVFSIGRGVHDNPRPEIVKAITSYQTAPYVTCTQLANRCSEQTGTADYPHLSDLFAAGRSAKSCCSGSVSINLKDLDIAQVRKDAHGSFIQKNIPTPLCQVAKISS